MVRLLPTPLWSARARFGVTLALLSPAAAASAGLLASETPAAPSAVEFGAGLDRALPDAARDGLPVAVVFGAGWCPACTRFREGPGRDSSPVLCSGCCVVADMGDVVDHFSL
jgi:hypothetical protein